MSDERDEGKKRGREPRLRDFARRMFRDAEEPPDSEPERPSHQEARDLFGSVLETGDKAKTEIVRMVAREVRSYLEALELHKDLNHLLTNYSLEVKASIHLRPLAAEEKGTSSGPSELKVGLKPMEPDNDSGPEGEGGSREG